MAAEAAEAEFEAMFKKGETPADMPKLEAVAGADGAVRIARLLVDAGVCKSTSEAGRLIAQGGLRIDGERVSDAAKALGPGTYVVQAGKLGDRALHVVDIPPELQDEWRVEEDFLAAVKSKGRVQPHPNFDDGLGYMRVVQAVADSRSRNEWVAIKR